MTKKLLLAILAIVIIGTLIYFAIPLFSKFQKIFYPNFTYTTKTYRPYDIKYAAEQFKKKSTKGFVINDEALDEENKNLKGGKKLLVIVSPYFMPNEEEMAYLNDFVSEGNNVFLSAFTISPNFYRNILQDTNRTFSAITYFPPVYQHDSLSLKWYDTETGNSETFSYPGKRTTLYIDSTLNDFHSSEMLLLNKDSTNRLLDFNLGKGHIYLLQSPEAMTNYFLLHKNNYRFLNIIFEQTDMNNRKVIWDDFFRKYDYQRNEPNENNEPGESYFWKVIGDHPTLAWAVFTFFLCIGLFILINSRRIQEPITVIPEVKNHSIDFVKAVSGLYWNKQDHKKIAEKLVSQFQDYMATNYKLTPREISFEKVDKIAQKTNKSTQEIEEVIRWITFVETTGVVSKQNLIDFYSIIYKFTNQ
jgi:hypothetical protein